MRVRTVLLMTGAAAVTAAVAYGYAVRPWWRSWGVDPEASAAPLPGDDLVPDATGIETRTIEIAAPPAAVWPWLVQMGFGRAGWYSYDAIDMRGKSADRVNPEWQTLAEGDLVPVAPDAGFVVRALDPGRELVLYTDDALVAEQAEKAKAARQAGQAVEETPANLEAVGRMMPSMPGFAASWAFVLEPLDGGIRTRLVERLRLRAPSTGQKGMEAFLPVLGFGVFVMVRKQLLGVRDRVERAVAADVAEPASPPAEPAAEPAAG
jgi:hypothetical protein